VALLALVLFLGPAPLLWRAEAPLTAFQEAVEQSPCITIVEELGANDRNVMQCGVDYAADFGALGKEVHVYAFDTVVCTYEGGQTLAPICLGKVLAEGCPILYISGKRPSNSYEGLLLVGVGEEYRERECSVLVNGVPAYQYILSRLANNSTSG